MALLPLELKERIADHLGYQDLESLEQAYTQRWQEDFLNSDKWNSVSIEGVEGWLDELDDINTKLKEARSDSMAVKVGDLGLSYKQHVGHLLYEGRRIQANLAGRIGVAIAFYHWGEASKAYFCG